MQHSDSIPHSEILCRPRRKHILPRNAIHNRLLVPQGRARKTILHLPHQQRHCKYVLRLSHGRSIPARRTRWFRGWQLLFLIDGIISLPVAISGFFVLPDVPEISSPWYLSEKEVELSQKRMKLEGRKPREPYTKSRLKKIFTSWHIWLLTILHIAFNNAAASSQPVFQQYLKASTDPVYEVWQINAYPTTTNAVQVVTTLIYAWTSDTILGGRRWPPIIFGAIMNIICYVSLAIWDIPTS